MEGTEGEAGSGTLLVLDPKPFKPFKSKDEYLYAMKEDLSEWFFCLYRIDISVDNFFEVLETGVILCDHAVSVQNFARERRIVHADLELRSYFIREIPDGGIPCKHGVKPKTFQARDNISNFISWCRKLGIPQVLLFETDDLVLRKNERSVVLCLLEVARIGAKLGMLAPVLVQMEEEIDAELAGDPPPQIKTCDLRSLDEMVRELVGRCTCPAQFPIIQVGDGKYKIGDSQTLIFVRILRNHVMVRVGGGWDTLENYLDKHDPCRCGFRGHRNSPASGQYGAKPGSQGRRTSAPSVQQTKSQTPRSNRSMSVAGPSASPQLQTTEYQHVGSPSPERQVHRKLPSRVSLGSLGNITERSFGDKPQNSAGKHESKDNSSLSNYRDRSHSPSPLSDAGSSGKQRTYSQQGESSYKQNAASRNKSPGPIPRPSGVSTDVSPEQPSRPKTPVNRCKSPGIPRAIFSTRPSSPDLNSRPRTPVYRSKSPGPPIDRSKSPGPAVDRSKSPGPAIDKSKSPGAAITRSKSPGPLNRSKSPVPTNNTNRSKSPGPMYKPSPLARAESPEPNPRWASPSPARAKSPAPLSTSIDNRPMSPENRYVSKMKQNGSNSPGTIRRAATPVERAMARTNRTEARANAPGDRCKSPGPIPRSRLPRSQSPFPRESIEDRTSGKRPPGSTENVPGRIVNSAPVSPGTGPNSNDNMETAGDINIERISTMTLSEFKSLLSTALSVPNSDASPESAESPRAQDVKTVRSKSSCAKTVCSRTDSGLHSSRTKPPASPRRAKSTVNLSTTESSEHGVVHQDKQKRTLPQSPVDSADVTSLADHRGSAKQASSDKLSTTSSSSDISRVTADPESPTRPRPSTPSSLTTRLPRPKTPSGIPRPSTPKLRDTGKRQQSPPREKSSETPRKQLPRPSSPYRPVTPRRPQTPEPMAQEVWVRHRSPSPEARPPVPSYRQRTMSEPVIDDPVCDEASSQQDENSAMKRNSESQNSMHHTVIKPSRLRPPSPSRLPLAMSSVDFEREQPVSRGRPANRTYLEQFRRRPSSAGQATVIASRYTKQKQQSTEATEQVTSGSSENEASNGSGGAKKYFGRRNAKTIIKANSALSKARSVQNVADSEPTDEMESTGNANENGGGTSASDRSRSRTRSEGFQLRQRPKSAGPRPLVRQDAEDRSIIVNRRGAGQHSITITTGEKTMYESKGKQVRPSSAKTAVTQSVISSSANSKGERGRSREVSKSQDLTQRRYRPKSAGPRSPSPVTVNPTSRKTGSSGIPEKVSNRYVSTGNLVRAWEEKSSEKPAVGRRQLPPSPRKCVTPSPLGRWDNHSRSQTRSVTPGPMDDDHELLSRPLSEIKAALKLPINGISKINVDPTKLDAPPEDAVMFQKMEELFHKYREKELNGGDSGLENGHDSASTNSEDVDRGHGSADDEGSVDSNSNIKSKLRASRSDSAITSTESFDVTDASDLETVRFEASVVAQLSEILKPAPRKEPSVGVKSRIPAPKFRFRSRSASEMQNGESEVRTDLGNHGGIDDFGADRHASVNLGTSVNCVNSQLTFSANDPRTKVSNSAGEDNTLCNSNPDLHREDSSTSLSDISLSSSQGGFRSETPVPKLAQPLCTGRSTLFNTRKERSASVTSVQGTPSARLVRAISLDHSFTSTGNSIPDTSFSLAEDEEYV